MAYQQTYGFQSVPSFNSHWSQQPASSPLRLNRNQHISSSPLPPLDTMHHRSLVGNQPLASAPLPVSSPALVSPPSFVDLPNQRGFVPQYWSSVTSTRPDNSFLTAGLESGFNPTLPPLQPSQNLVSAYPLPSLGHSASVPNLRMSQDMSIGHGPPPTYPGPSSHNPWATVSPSQIPAVPSPTFTMPVTPFGGSGSGARHDPGLLSAMDYALSRTNSASSMGSLVDMGQSYTPLSSHSGSDYFGRDTDDLRRVSAAVDDVRMPADSGHSFEGHQGPGTIHLSRIHEGRTPVTDVAHSISESECSWTSHQPSPSRQESIHATSTTIKSEVISPPGGQLVCSPASSVDTDRPGSPKAFASPAAAIKPGVTSPLSCLSHPPPSQKANSTSSHYDPFEDDDGFVSQDDNDDDDFRLRARKRTRRKKTRPSARRRTTATIVSLPRRPIPVRRRMVGRFDDGPVSLQGLVERYPSVSTYPLFSHALQTDLSLNEWAAPKIGTIPNSVTSEQKCQILRDFYHRGRRVLQQLDAFKNRCDPRICAPPAQGPWPEMPEGYRIAIRDVRRKIVERTENYKYTRRDILMKIHGKNHWDPIEDGMVVWDPCSGNNDPAGDLDAAGLVPKQAAEDTAGTFHSPTITDRSIRPIPSRSTTGSGSPAMTIAPNDNGPSTSLFSTPTSTLPFSALAVSASGGLAVTSGAAELSTCISPSGGINVSGTISGNSLSPTLPSPSALGLSLPSAGSGSIIARSLSTSYSYGTERKGRNAKRGRRTFSGSSSEWDGASASIGQL